MRSVVRKSSVDSSISYKSRTLPFAIRGKDVSSMDVTAGEDDMFVALRNNSWSEMSFGTM
jgi:hypothetical protein